jgi:putative ABC transport system permease protein
VEDDEGRNYFKENTINVSPEFIDVFSFDLVEGSANALKTTDNVIIPLSLSRKLFGNESAVGKQLVSGESNQMVGAVYRDFPANTIIDNYIYVAMPENLHKDNWGNWSYHTYIRVNDASNAPLLIDNFFRNLEGHVISGEPFEYEKAKETGMNLRLTVLPEVHFVKGVQWDNAPKTSRQTLLILLTIAIVIIAIAAINFTNFSTALTPMRVKSINTQRVLGARRSTLRWALVFEAVFVSLLSYCIALLLVALFGDSPFARLVDGDLSLMAHPLIYGGTALVAVFTGFLAGAYPSHYMTSFAPALVLKGNFGLSLKGKQLRNTLISIQFVASFALIIGASFMYMQNRFMQNAPLGYDKNAMIAVDIKQIQNNREAFTNQIKSYAGIEDITYGQFLLSSQDSYSTWGMQYKSEQIQFKVFIVHHTYLKVMGIKVSEGRDFRYEDPNTQHGAWIFNESARQKFNLELNTALEGWNNGEIIGFMPDVKFASFRTAVEPMAFFVMGTEIYSWEYAQIAYIKLKENTNMHAAMSHIHSTLSTYDSDYPFEVRFFDEVLQRLYEKETALGSLISLFSMMAIFISIVGIFGLVVFDSECRRKEIGIRKVLGASTWGIIAMFNKAYFKILVICFVVAAPLAWYAVHKWLENFAYKTPMYWWVYLLAFIVVGVITAATVTFQNWRVASDNPANTIMKSE